MKQSLTVEYDDGERVTLTALPPDFVSWERQYGRKLTDLADGIGMEDALYLAWSVLRRAGGERPPFDVWMNKVVDVEFGDGDPAPDPTPSAPSDGS